jgi:hypothetical protein
VVVNVGPARVPDFFIVGHAKCGTTALYRMLRAHPQIYMPDLKETHFLAREPHEREQAARRQPRTLEAYLALFQAAAPEQQVGEASTTYLRTPAAATRIAELCPDARMIAIFREPASFLHSLHLQLLQVGVETEVDFARAIGLEPERRRGRHMPSDSFWSQALLYSEHVRYVEQLRLYHERFGRERMLALIYDDFRLDNEAVVRQVLRFLEVDDSVEIELTEANPTVRVRARGAQDLVHAVSMGRGPVSRRVKTALKTVTPRRLRRDTLRATRRLVLEREPPPPAQRFMDELRRRFRGEVVAASEYLDRDLVGLWGYDDVR